MEVYASRVASFQTSSRKKQKWPHIRPTPKDLADAGFYYDPSPLSHDNVVCFLCKKALDGWDVEDDPVKEHIQHSGQCGWAILKYIKLGDKEMNTFTDMELQEARQATFGSWWPHEQKKGRFLKIIKMSQAGFYYNPTPDSNDMVSCIHCGLGLDGWEPKDDPMKEHKKRAPSCLFFQKSMITETGASKLKVSSNKIIQGVDTLDDDILSVNEGNINLKHKTNGSLFKTKGRTIVKKTTKKSKNNFQSQLKSPLTFHGKNDNNLSFNSIQDSVVDKSLVLDNPILVKQDTEENKLIETDNFSSFREMRVTRSRINSFSSDLDSLYIEKEITKGSKLKNTKRPSQQAKRANDLSELMFDNNYQDNIKFNSATIKKYKDGNVVGNEQNDLSIKPTRRLTRSRLSAIKDNTFEGIGFNELQNDFITIKTVSSKGHRKINSLKSNKSGRKSSLKASRGLSYDNIQKKMELKSQNLKIEKKDELIKDKVMSIEIFDTEEKSTQVLKISNATNSKKKLKNISKLSKLSEDIPLQPTSKGNNSEKSDDFLKQVKTFDDSVIKNGFDDSLQHKSKRIFDFNTSKNQIKNSKDISIMEICNNDDDKKISNWVPINIQAFVLNSSNNNLINSHEFTAAELDMTIEEWIKFITQKQIEKLEIECKKMISVLKKEGERARQAILSIYEL
ncbi:hypothetical protein PCANB_002094 [Pneumocystis canis]|nr:hypothetical protein PCANB_002094 [Pneumocystis canis]